MTCFFSHPKVHHRRICSSPVAVGVQPPLSPSQVQQRAHGVAQKQLWFGRQRRFPEEEEPPVAHHLLSTGPDFPDRRHPQQAGTHAEPIRRRAAGVYPQPQPGGSTTQHEHYSQLLGPQQQHQAGSGDFQPQMTLEVDGRNTEQKNCHDKMQSVKQMAEYNRCYEPFFTKLTPVILKFMYRSRSIYLTETCRQVHIIFRTGSQTVSAVTVY